MNHLLSFALLLALVAAPVTAQGSDGPASDEKNKATTQKTAPKATDVDDDNGDEAFEDIDLSLRRPVVERGDGFIYLTERSPIQTITDKNSKRPTFSSLLAPSGSIRNVRSGVLDRSSRIGLSFGSDEDSRGLEIAIESAFQLSGNIGKPTSNEIYSLEQQFAERVYNVGVSVGYSGFNLDATVIREQSLLNGDTEGFGVGFSYTGNRWAARFSLSEYTEGSDLYGINNEVRNFVSLELGATYNLSERWGILGGIRYSDMRNAEFLADNPFRRSQSVFLGGRFRF